MGPRLREIQPEELEEFTKTHPDSRALLTFLLRAGQRGVQEMILSAQGANMSAVTEILVQTGWAEFVAEESGRVLRSTVVLASGQSEQGE